MKLVFISDTHGLHEALTLKGGDILIHAGDISKSGDILEVFDFLDWFKTQAFETKIFIAGNHDFYFEDVSQLELNEYLPQGVIYLNDSGVVVNGLNIWGSPIQPWFHNWAFNRQRGDDIQQHWDLIPENTDILITHGPPHGILDTTISGEAVGCKRLRETLLSLKLKVHAFGHIHESYGTSQIGQTTFVNASNLDVKYNVVNDPIRLVL